MFDYLSLTKVSDTTQNAHSEIPMDFNDPSFQILVFSLNVWLPLESLITLRILENTVIF